MKLELDIDVKVLDRLRRRSPRLVRQATLQMGMAVEAEAVRQISRGGSMRSEATGNLKHSIGTRLSKKGGYPVAEVYAASKYAAYVHEGTGIYGPSKQPIVPGTSGDKAYLCELPVSGKVILRQGAIALN